MDRRDFLKTTSGAAAAVAGAAVAVSTAHAADDAQLVPAALPPISSKNARELSFAISGPDTGRGPGESARRLARRIEVLTGGAYKICAIPDAKAGTADIWHGSAHDLRDADAAFSYFAGLPGPHGLAPADLDAWMAIGGGQGLWDELAAAHGFKPLLAGHTGTAPAIWSQKPLSAESGFQGIRFSAEGLAREVARGLGAETVDVLAVDFASSLQTGAVVAIEGPGAAFAMAAGLPQVAPYALAAGINRCGVAQSISIKLSVWESLPDSVQAAFAAAAAEEFRLSNAEARIHEALAWRVMRSRHGIELRQPADELINAISRVSDAVVAHVAGASRSAQRINASFMAFRAMLPVPGLGQALT